MIESEGHIGHGAVLHGCRIGRNAMVGMNAVVMDEARIGENATIAAMAFVKAKTEIPPGSLAVGSPAKVLRQLSEQEIAWKRQGTAIYRRLAAEAEEKLRPVAPLPAVEERRRRIKAPEYDPLFAAKLKMES